MLNIRSIVKLALAVIVLCGLLALSFYVHKHLNASKTPPAVLVSGATVHKANVEVKYSYAGTISSANETKIISQVSGILLKNNFVEGAAVKAGDILFQIDPKEYKMQLLEAQAKKEAAQSAYLQAQKTAKRAQQLLEQKILAQSTAEDIMLKCQQAASSFKQADLAYEQAKLNLEHCTIRAPIDGAMGKRLMAEGSFVAAGNSVLAVLTQLDKLYVDFALSSKDFMEIKKAQLPQTSLNKNNSLFVRVYPMDSSYSELAKLSFMSPVIDQTTDTVNARAILSHSHKFIPGQFVRCELEGSKQYGIAIPEGALLQDTKATYIYVLRKMQIAPNMPAQLLAIRTSVHVIKQLQDRRWLLEVDPGGKNTVKEGDIILTKGIFMVESAAPSIAGKLPGLPVVLTNLDDKNVV